MTPAAFSAAIRGIEVGEDRLGYGCTVQESSGHAPEPSEAPAGRLGVELGAGSWLGALLGSVV